MSTFKDKQGREWTIALDVPLCRETQKLGVDFLNLKVDPIAKVSMDPLLLADVLWACCKSQASSLEITQDDFQKSLGGDEFDAAIASIKEAIVHFRPESQRAAVLEQLKQNEKVQSEGFDLAISKIETDRPRIRAAMQKLVDKEFDNIIAGLESSVPGTAMNDK